MIHLSIVIQLGHPSLLEVQEVRLQSKEYTPSRLLSFVHTKLMSIEKKRRNELTQNHSIAVCFVQDSSNAAATSRNRTHRPVPKSRKNTFR